ncbi:phosphatidate cytidylyltransferase family protein [Tritrichomonas foetus]|uniref:dolichol kinase n=1 Tax=Tritrichomonas foetus TaxID=1144522 RepID=A0A1J4KIW7_9EUKA|nr:phosphatidate cytidylyltransferase family protein [Tritrichomonas foetus]|eukprot:OHT10880.1 phosphatidate cytidylyltransferase family protein [Tritrichomonas foetus]
MNLENYDAFTWSICLLFASALRIRKGDYIDFALLLLHLALTWIYNNVNIRKSFRHGAGTGIVCGFLAVPAALGSLEASTFHISLIISLIFDLLFLLNHTGIPTLDYRFTPLVPITATLLITKLYNISIWIPLLSVFMGIFVLSILMKFSPNSFTIGESVMVSTLSSLPIQAIFKAVGVPRFSALYITFGIICVTLSLAIRKPFVIFIILIPMLVGLLDIVEVFYYLLNIKRILLVAACGLIVLVFMIISVYWKGLQQFPQIIQRKFFHLMALLVFVPPVLVDYEFLRLCISGAIFVFLIVESLRLVKFPVISKYIQNYVQDFIDERDGGELILTHLFLLLGLGLPVLIARDDIPGGLTVHTCGISVLAVGDAAASIIGVNFGKHKWPGSKKSIEGTIGAFFGTFLSLFVIHQFKEIDFSLELLFCLIVPSLFGAFDEAFTSQIDNLTLPFVMIPPILCSCALFL